MISVPTTYNNPCKILASEWFKKPGVFANKNHLLALRACISSSIGLIGLPQRFVFSAIILILVFPFSSAVSAPWLQQHWPADVEQALVHAEKNRPNLEKVLNRYKSDKDRLKFEAACFLIKNMPGHGYVQTALYDQKNKEVPYDVLKYKSFNDAKKAMDELESKFGKTKFKRKAFIEDSKTLKAEYLIENIESAFATWRSNPWTADMSFETFCEYILPYRATSEPAESWRDDCKIDKAKIVEQMKNSADRREAAGQIGRLTKRRVYFKKLYYLHPTDQGFAQLCEKPFGRCEDQQTMQTYVMRANGIAVAGDYTPHWANRDNNHAWEVMLDKDGRGRAGLSNRAAKVYRKMFSHNPDNLFFHNAEKEKIPRWLSGRTFRDVTDQYMKTSDVTVQLETPPPEKTRYAYICVFNGGHWRAIHWSPIQEKRATFTKMGRNIAYLVAYYVNERLVAAAPPMIVDAKGQPKLLKLDAEQSKKLHLAAATENSNVDGVTQGTPANPEQLGKDQQLFVWQGSWKSVKASFDPKDPTTFANLPSGGLYWIVSDSTRQNARIFTIENGKPRHW